MMSALTASGLPVAGTGGTALGTSIPMAPRAITAMRRATNGISAAESPSARGRTTCWAELRRIGRTIGARACTRIPLTGELRSLLLGRRADELPYAADLVEAELLVQQLRPVVAVGQKEDQVVFACVCFFQRAR